MSKSKCSITGCEKVTNSRGWCKMHHTRWLRHGDPLTTLRRTRCDVDGCQQEHAGKGYCAMHYVRYRKHGNPHTVMRDMSHRGRPLPERFRAKVAVTANPDRCWEWQSSKGLTGYGYFTVGDDNRRATHVAWFITHAVWPSMHVLHSCDNPGCVNPSHLREGTHADNMRDKVERRRCKHGVNHFRARFVDDDIRAIRGRLASGDRAGVIAKDYTVATSTIRAIEYGLTWTHVI